VAERYVLDTSAIFAFTDQEEGASQVERILDLAGKDQCRVEICSASLMELYYTTLQEVGEDQAARLLGMVKSWPIHWVFPDEQTLLLAGRFKARHRLSFADAQIAATAKRNDATLVHKDPEFAALAAEVRVIELPLKGARPADAQEDESREVS